MPMTPRRMAQLKANFRAGHESYNRIVKLHKNIQRMNKELTNLHSKLIRSTTNENHALRMAQNNYPTPTMTNRMRLFWLVKMRKARSEHNNASHQIHRVRTDMLPAMIEFARLHWGAGPNNINVEGNVRNYVRKHSAPNIRLGKLKLAHAINRAVVRPGGWIYKRMFKPGNNPIPVR